MLSQSKGPPTLKIFTNQLSTYLVLPIPNMHYSERPTIGKIRPLLINHDGTSFSLPCSMLVCHHWPINP